MYDAEVLCKRVVVQHLPLGGIIEWGSPADDGEAEEETAQTTGHLAAPVLGSGGSVHSSPGSTHEPLPGGSPMSSLNPLPAVRNLSLGTSPARQNSMPRPRGGKIAAALAASPVVPSGPTLHEEDERHAAVAPVTSQEDERDDAAEPDLKKESEVLDAPTSPQNVAKILTANPVDHRLMSSSTASIDKKVAPAPVFIPPEVAAQQEQEALRKATVTPPSAPEASTTSATQDAGSAPLKSAEPVNTATSPTPPKPTESIAQRKVSPFERIANLLGCGRRK